MYAYIQRILSRTPHVNQTRVTNSTCKSDTCITRHRSVCMHIYREFCICLENSWLIYMWSSWVKTEWQDDTCVVMVYMYQSRTPHVNQSRTSRTNQSRTLCRNESHTPNVLHIKNRITRWHVCYGGVCMCIYREFVIDLYVEGGVCARH